MSMAISKHLWKVDKISYDPKDFSQNSWKVQISYKVFLLHPNFSDRPIETN